MEERDATLMPVGFVSHGAPTLALDHEKGAELTRWAAAMPRPEAIVVISAHWEETPARLGTVEPEELYYDFGGFDRKLYELKYEAPGAPELADRVSKLLGGPRREGVRMWDHGVWVPLVHMYPEADVPVLQVSLPSGGGADEVYELGRRLRPLREEGVLVLGSGGMVHNLRAIDWSGRKETPDWAVEFEEWMRGRLRDGDVEGIRGFERDAPHARWAHPTCEHILPLIAAVGAVGEEFEVEFPVTGFEYGSLSRTAVELR